MTTTQRAADANRPMVTNYNRGPRAASVRFEEVNDSTLHVFWRVHRIGRLVRMENGAGWWFTSPEKYCECLIDILPWHKEKAKGVIQQRINSHFA